MGKINLCCQLLQYIQAKFSLFLQAGLVIIVLYICGVHVVPTDGKTGSSHARFGDDCISIWRYTLNRKEFSLNCRVYTLSVTGPQNKEQMVT